MSDTLGVINYQAISTLGTPLAGVLVAVLSGDLTTVVTTTQPGSPLATIYTDPAGLNPILNPAMTDGDGNLNICVATGYYVLQVYGLGVVQQLQQIRVSAGVVGPLTGPTTPTSAGTTGATGQITWSGSTGATGAIYVCTAGGTAGNATWMAATLTKV